MSIEVKYLGVILDWRFSRRSHIAYSIQKAHFATNTLAKLLYNQHLSLENGCLLYKTVIRPILLYAVPVWGFAAPSSQKIQTEQNKTLSRIRRASWYQRSSFIHSDLRIQTIRY